MRRAAKVDSNHREVVAALRAAGCEVLDLSRVGGGCPDLLVYRTARGLLRLLEVKVAKGRLTELQQTKFMRLPVWVVRSPAEALAAMEVEIA